MATKDIQKFKMKKGETLNPNGRPPKVMTTILKEFAELGYKRVSPSEIIETYEFLLGMDLNRLKEIASDEKQPMMTRIVVKAMLSPKGAEMLDKMMDRAHGKAIQKSESKTDLTSDGKPINFGIKEAIMQAINSNTVKDAEVLPQTNTSEVSQ